MNGSLDSEFRRSIAECAARSRAREAELTPPVDLAHPEILPCAMCGKDAHAGAFCAKREAVWELLWRRDLMMFGRRLYPVLCKRCCTAEMAGHCCPSQAACWR